MECDACKATIKVIQKRVTCNNSTCQRSYHSECVQFTDSPVSRSEWICPLCVASQRKLVNNNTPVRSYSSQNLPTQQEVPAESVILTELKSFRTEINTKLDLQENSFNEFKKSFECLKNDVSDITNRINLMETRICHIEGLNLTVEDCLLKIKETNSKIQKIENELRDYKEVKTSVRGLIVDSRNKDQWLRRSNIEIIGIPEASGENLNEIVQKLAMRCQFPLDPTVDVDFITRVATKSADGVTKPRPIIIKMIKRYKKDDFLVSLRKIKGLKLIDIGIDSSGKVYANDHLTAFNKYLLRQAKQLAKENDYSLVWVRNCSIMVRRTLTSPVIFISSEDDLKKIK